MQQTEYGWMGYRRLLVQLRMILIRMLAQRACDAYEREHYIKNDGTEGTPLVDTYYESSGTRFLVSV
jgi:hypothetical protein